MDKNLRMRLIVALADRLEYRRLLHDDVSPRAAACEIIEELEAELDITHHRIVADEPALIR